MNETIEQLLKNLEAANAARGTSVRCPVCPVGVGKFCRDEAGKVVTHEQRVKAVEAARLMNLYAAVEQGF